MSDPAMIALMFELPPTIKLGSTGFLYGVDPEYEDAMIENLRVGINTIGAELQRAMSGMRRQRRVALLEMAQRSAESVMDDLTTRALIEIREKSKSESIDAVSVMTKADMANFAEALVQITSMKRRASLEKETVGGPIDVAVISKDDGFVWVKRKHYFDPDLNPRYFFRKYGEMPFRKTGGAK